MPGFLTLVSEDMPGEVVANRLLRHVDPDARFDPRLGKRGINYIESRAKNLNHAAARQRIVVIADRDRVANCPSEIIQRWLNAPRSENLVIRFAEMEIESWIMADNEALANFLDVPLNRISLLPDTLENPKEALVNIARLSRIRAIREGICPPPGSSRVVGPLYNALIEQFVLNEWRPNRAFQNSPSLCRAGQRIRELALR